MIRGAGPEEICAFCDEFTRKDVAPELASLGIGRCLKYPAGGPVDVHVGWNAIKCVSFRLDRPNLGARRRYVDQQKAKPP